MAKKTSSTSGITHRDIINAVRQQQYAPVYLLMGEESYYIDKISEFIANSVLAEEERDFNLITIYCTKETNVADVINSAKRYPMMSKYQVVIVKEAQNLLKFEDLQYYLKEPLLSTILVICYKNGVIDRRKKVVGMIEKVGVVYESARLKDGMLPTFIDDYLRRKQVGIEDRAKMMLVENIGSDLNRLSSELDKLCIGATRITPELIEKNIGISKDFNMWEFKAAIVNHNILKANQIINYFNDNPKTNPPIMILSMLFNFFAVIMQTEIDLAVTGLSYSNELLQCHENDAHYWKIEGNRCKIKGSRQRKLHGCRSDARIGVLHPPLSSVYPCPIYINKV